MRKTQGQGHSLADRIVLRTERSGHPRPAAPVSQTLPPSRELRKVAASATPRKGRDDGLSDGLRLRLFQLI